MCIPVAHSAALVMNHILPVTEPPSLTSIPDALIELAPHTGDLETSNSTSLTCAATGTGKWLTLDTGGRKRVHEGEWGSTLVGVIFVRFNCVFVM